ncbi:hypothetical protein NE850_18910 [Paraburkholderia sp. USG1]|nr:hypothetical protein [Paraburkholderia sp. USG1]
MQRWSLDDLLEQAQFVGIQTALTGQTRYLIGAREFVRMKRTAFLINAVRGPVVDEKALIYALKNSAIHVAGLDVFTRWLVGRTRTAGRNVRRE